LTILKHTLILGTEHNEEATKKKVERPQSFDGLATTSHEHIINQKRTIAHIIKNIP